MANIRRMKGMAVIGVTIVLMLTICMTGCGSEKEALPEENVKYEVALVTNNGLIMDGGHSEIAWNAITEFGATNGISHKYYKATESTKGAFIDAIKNAINNGAKIVIVDNGALEEAVYKMQEKYPEIDFVLIVSSPFDSDTGDIKLTSNTTALSFDSSQAGYLAGYAAVIEGYTNLGFIGESKSEEIRGFGYGYVKGANTACSELGINVNVKYTYCPNMEREEIYKRACKMYSNGTEVIFAAGPSLQEAVIEAAEAKNGKVIGSNTDQSSKSDTVITSAIYNINEAIKKVLKDYENDKFPGGDVISYNAHNSGISLELRNNKLDTLTKKQYDAVYKTLNKGEVQIDISRESVHDIEAPNVIIE